MIQALRRLALVAMLLIVLYVPGYPGRVHDLGLPGGYAVVAGSPWGDGYPLVVYGRSSNLSVGDLVVFCAGGGCYAGRVAGFSAGMVTVEGWGPTLPARIPYNYEGLYEIILVLPARAWIPLLILLAAGVYASLRDVLGEWSVAAGILAAAVIILSSLTPALATTQLTPPDAVLRGSKVSPDYSLAYLEIDWDGLSGLNVTSCRVSPALNYSVDAPAAITSKGLIVGIPDRAWEKAVESQGKRLVFITVECQVSFDSGVINVYVPIWTVFGWPNLTVQGRIVLLENPLPVPVNYSLDIIVYVRPPPSTPIVLTESGTLPARGMYVVYVGDNYGIVVNGRVYAPWGTRPLGAVGGQG